MTRRFVGLEQSMVALERVKEYTDLVREPAEFQEPRPPVSWPTEGAIEVKDLVIRYAVSATFHVNDLLLILNTNSPSYRTCCTSSTLVSVLARKLVFLDELALARARLHSRSSASSRLPRAKL
jgi:hypothetical protein